jgi:hypothetical protein
MCLSRFFSAKTQLSVCNSICVTDRQGALEIVGRHLAETKVRTVVVKFDDHTTHPPGFLPHNNYLI